MLGKGSGSWYKWTVSDESNYDKVCILVSRQFFIVSSLVYWFNAKEDGGVGYTVSLIVLWILLFGVTILWNVEAIKSKPLYVVMSTFCASMLQTGVCIVISVALSERCTPYVVGYLAILIMVESCSARCLFAILLLGITVLTSSPSSKSETISLLISLADICFVIVFKILYASNVEIRYEKTKRDESPIMTLNSNRKNPFGFSKKKGEGVKKLENAENDLNSPEYPSKESQCRSCITTS